MRVVIMSFRGLVTNLDLYVALRQHKDVSDYNHLFNVIKSNSSVQICESFEDELRNWCRQFCYRVKAKWIKSGRIADKFIRKNSEWLSYAIHWPECIKENIVQTEETPEVVTPSKPEASISIQKSPRKSFEDLSNRQKRRRTEQARATTSENELVFSTECILQSSGKGEVSKIMKYLLENPHEVSKVLSFIGGETTQPRVISTQKALALYITMRLSKWRYITLRDFSLKEGMTQYPSYYMLLKEKTECYPRKKDITITNNGAKIKLQSLLDLTVIRLIKSLNCSIDTFDQLVLHSKWGFDGASNQNVYHQRTPVSSEDLSTVFMASLVPLKLIEQTTENILWHNDRPSSTIYCRPISFKFMKETEANIKSELAAFESEISNLTPTDIGNTMVTHNLMLTMIDGKIHSYISETSSAVCDLCKTRPTQMNKLEEVRAKPVEEELYKYGLSSLHAWIRSMECLLHISYKMEIKSWQAKGKEIKQKVKSRKVAIQESFRRETGLLLDVVKQGSGNTNTGNTARRFFADPETTARITGLDIRLIRKIAVVLQCISSGEQINIDKFREYCNATADLYVELYPWYYMPSSLHKLLIHGPQIVEHLSVVPIGFLSEEASEARNKEFRKCRSDHTRKCSNIATNEDILHNLLLSSDPLLSSIRQTMRKKAKRVWFKEVKELLVFDEHEIEFIDIPSIPDIHSESSDDDLDDD